MIDIDNLFGLFPDDGDLDGGDTPVYLDFTTTPVYWIGMYKKLVLNHINFNKKVVKFFKESNQELDVEDMSDAGEFVVYHREYGDEYLDTSLELGIHFFEEYEEYEKCASLKKILDKTKESSI